MEFNYQKKRKHTIGKLIVMSLATLLPIIAYFVLGAIYRFFNSPEKIDLVVLRLLVLIIFELAIAFKIVLYIRIIASEEFANKYFIKKNDERNIYKTAYNVIYNEAIPLFDGGRYGSCRLLFEGNILCSWCNYYL